MSSAHAVSRQRTVYKVEQRTGLSQPLKLLVVIVWGVFQNQAASRVIGESAPQCN